MTITEAVDYVRRLHNAESDTNWSDAEIYSLFEAKSNEVMALIGLKEATATSTSVAGTADYAYPTNAVHIRRVLYSGQALKRLNFRQYQARIVSGTAPSGTPREYTLWNDTITLVPVPDTSSDTITIYSENQQSSITSSSSTLDIPGVLHQALCDGVLWMMFAKDLNAQFMSMFKNRWDEHKLMMREFVKRRRRTGSAATIVDTDSSLETEFGVI